VFRVVMVEDSNKFLSDSCEFYLKGPFEEVWKQANYMLADSRYREVFIYRPSDDAICYHATDWFGSVCGQFKAEAV